MVEFTAGDIFKVEAAALVNAVNCVGIMGSGVALQFKKRFPENFHAYSRACVHGEVRPGRMFIFDTGLVRPECIINFPTKRHWRDPSRLADIDAGLDALREEIRGRDIGSIAIPALGCGLGGLEWGVVKASMERVLGDLKGVRVIVFSPQSEVVSAMGPAGPLG